VPVATPPPLPPVADVRAWLQVPVTALSDADLLAVITAEAVIQQRICAFPGDATYPEPLLRALYRRCARHIAARQIPLGVTGEGEYGSVRLSGYDAEVRRLEASYRIPVIA
jgi:hypothetical protein